ncbi:hypothetical protein BBJ28_00003575 [Nothophytophthora sp. Chile5]|nr:hypothetical protein BBJ28_00003575 [Nothophytophthora sp. Chile5]
MRMRQQAVKKYCGKLLFLGLDGAGKSTLVQHLSRLATGDDVSLLTATMGRELPAYLYPDPNQTLQTASYRLDASDQYLQFLDPPGRRVFRANWYSIINDPSSFSGSSNNLTNPTAYAPASGGSISQPLLPVLGVVFVVDAADPVRFPVVAAELVRFLKLKEQNKVFQKAQFFLVFNKSDRLLPAPPPEALELQSSKAQQQQLNSNRLRQRAALRDTRHQLRQCVDYALKMDQRRHPADYRVQKGSAATRSTSSSKSQLYSPSLLFAQVLTPPAAPVAGEITLPRINGDPKGEISVLNSSTPLASALFTSVTECCAHDRESIRALRTWLTEEMKRSATV